MKGIFYFDTKYGSTLKVGEWVISSINCADIDKQQVKNGLNADNSYDFYLFGFPIFVGKPSYTMIQFIKENKLYLVNKPIFVFFCSWAQATIYKDACKEFADLIQTYFLPCKPILIQSLPGTLYMNKITEKDQNILKRLLRRLSKMSAQFEGEKIDFNDQTNLVESKKMGLNVNEWLSRYALKKENHPDFIQN